LQAQLCPFNEPVGVALDAARNIYVADRYGNAAPAERLEVGRAQHSDLP